MIDYLPKTSEQLLGFIYSVGIGLALGFVYGLLRILFFILSGSDKKFTLTRDIIFFLQFWIFLTRDLALRLTERTKQEILFLSFLRIFRIR